MNEEQTKEEMLCLLKTGRKLMVFFVALTVMQGALIAHYMYSLKLSRSNEREMSRRIYEVGKWGGTNAPATTNENKTIKTNSIGPVRPDGGSPNPHKR